MRFAGYKQQDSQELLRYLLDSLRNEEVDVSALQSRACPMDGLFLQRIKHAILKSFGVSKTSMNQLTDAQKKDIRGIFLKHNRALGKGTDCVSLQHMECRH